MSTDRQEIIPLAPHLSRRDIFDRYRLSLGAEERTYWQIIYLKCLGKVVNEIAQVTGYPSDWVRRLIARFNEEGPDNFVKNLPSTLATPEQQADYARKTRELDTARVAQQSLLSAPAPSHEDLDIAAFMRTASEVGGDYFDFAVSEGGAVTAAVGDATGHDTKAGMMVAATKALFTALAPTRDLLDLTRILTETLKQLNLRGLYMGLSLARYHEGSLELVVAGMPPVFSYNAKTRTVSQVVLKGMPLGSFADFPYQRHVMPFAPGDAVLLVTDGVTELVNPAGHMLTADRVCWIFQECAHRSAEDIVQTVRAAGRAWRAEQPLQDDATLLALRRV